MVQGRRRPMPASEASSPVFVKTEDKTPLQ